MKTLRTLQTPNAQQYLCPIQMLWVICDSSRPGIHLRLTLEIPFKIMIFLNYFQKEIKCNYYSKLLNNNKDRKQR